MNKLLVLLCVLSVVVISCGQDARQERTVTGPAGQTVSAIELSRLHGQQEFPNPLPEPGSQVTGDVVSWNTAQVDEEDTITPSSLSATLNPGECLSVTKEVSLTGTTIQKGDILFALDLTGSMSEELNNVQTEILNIIAQLDAVIDDPAFGVIGYMDYDGLFDFCDYAMFYGEAADGDLPYILGQPIDTDPVASQNAINALTNGNGQDQPEAEARVFFETYSDAAVGWRDGARRIVVNFGDALPHDCDVGACLGMDLGSTGVDPGRDATVGTADDLPILDVLAGMAANNITLIRIQSNNADLGGASLMDLWDCLTALTPGGTAVQINNDGTVPGGLSLADLIASKVGEVAEICDVLTLEASPGFEDWLQNLTPPSYMDLELPATVNFDLDICVPPDTPPGQYVFEICAVCDGGVRVCEADTINVPGDVGRVHLDIHPTSCPNPLNRGKKGVVPAAILGTEDFDVTNVDPSTLLLEGVPPLRWALEDVATPFDGELCDCTTEGPDGFMDLTLKFDAPLLQDALAPLVPGDVLTLTLTGNLLDGTAFEAQDCMIIRGGRPPR